MEYCMLGEGAISIGICSQGREREDAVCEGLLSVRKHREPGKQSREVEDEEAAGDIQLRRIPSSLIPKIRFTEDDQREVLLSHRET